jgi:threonine dehydrogenase-like Zn-dependent dehydrogenase
VKQVLQDNRTGVIRVVEVPSPAVRPGFVLVRNAYSVISSGTERGALRLASKSLIGKARERPDLVRKVLRKASEDGLWSAVQAVQTRLEQPATPGYSCAGTILETGEGVNDLRPGDRVACAGANFATHAEVVCVPVNLCVRVPGDVPLDEAAFVTLGAIALQGLRVAQIQFGEVVLVIGLGVVGQLAAQLLKAAGCKVVGMDPLNARAQLARQLGADVAVGPDAVASAVDSLTGGHGADAVIVTAATTSSQPVALAGELARDKGRVVLVGAVGMDVPRRPYYEKELELRLSRSYGPGRYDPAYEEQGRDYPYGYVRWTERRNMQAFVDAVAGGRLSLAPLVTHRFPVEEAERGYGLLGRSVDEAVMAIVLSYPQPIQEQSGARTLQFGEPREPRPGAPRLGVLGAGTFAQSVLLPRLKRLPVELVGVATSTGHGARQAGERFGFRYCATDVERVLSDPEIDAVVIATRHDSHADLVARALRRGKDVFVEKPLAVTRGELAAVLDAWIETGCRGRVQVGFNRRFAPMMRRIQEELGGRRSPLVANWRVNAGPLPRDSWLAPSPWRSHNRRSLPLRRRPDVSDRGESLARVRRGSRWERRRGRRIADHRPPLPGWLARIHRLLHQRRCDRTQGAARGLLRRCDHVPRRFQTPRHRQRR